jgi:hypothetical protein
VSACGASSAFRILEGDRLKKTLYQILDVDPKASTEQIIAAHAQLANVRDTQWPDANMPGLLQQAREILADPQRRAAYDRSLVTGSVIEASSGFVAEPSFLEAWGKWIAAALVLGALTWWGTTLRETPRLQTHRVVPPLTVSRPATTDVAPL